MNKYGFTLIEIILVMTIAILLLTFTTINLISFQQNTFVNTSVEQLMSDMKYQQISAMNGAANSASEAQRFGIHFDVNSYTLFHGGIFNHSEPTNLTIALDGGISFSDVTFPQNEIIFEKGSGDIMGFIDGRNTVIVKDSGSNNQIVITVNKFGTITQIQ